MRIQKYIALCGVASRRRAEELILEGAVTLNGSVVTKLGTEIDETTDKIKVNGKLIRITDSKVYIMLNKPKGYITSLNDEKDRKTVMDLLERVKERVVPVGRLDYNTSGLLLLSNDGDFVYKLTHPKHKIGKVYEVKVKGIPSNEVLNKLRNGVVIDGEKTSKAVVKIKKKFDTNSILEIVIFEGRNRQIRKMCEVVGLNVLSLKRTQIGTLTLDIAKEGEYRYLKPEEIKKLLAE